MKEEEEVDDEEVKGSDDRRRERREGREGIEEKEEEEEEGSLVDRRRGRQRSAVKELGNTLSSERRRENASEDREYEQWRGEKEEEEGEEVQQQGEGEGEGRGGLAMQIERILKEKEGLIEKLVAMTMHANSLRSYNAELERIVHSYALVSHLSCQAIYDHHQHHSSSNKSMILDSSLLNLSSSFSIDEKDASSLSSGKNPLHLSSLHPLVSFSLLSPLSLLSSVLLSVCV